jgi:hypothetical protein
MISGSLTFIGSILVFVGILIIAVLTLSSRQSLVVRKRLLIGLGTSVLGSLLYLNLVGTYYGGGDYLLYFRDGQRYASLLLEQGWSAAFAELTREGAVRWWGTRFTSFLSGLLFSAIGASLPSASIVFGLAGFAGTVAIWAAARRAIPTIDGERTLLWLVLYPSLWFWPGILGKDAIVLFGVGVASLGLAGKNGRIRWGLLVLGVAAVFVIRPQVAATVVFALVAGLWLATAHYFTFGRAFQGTLLVGAGIGVVLLAGGNLGVQFFEVQDVVEYVDSRAAVSQQGGGSIEGADKGIALWLAPVNVLFRPFPWEVSGPTGLLASIEMLVLWVLIWRRRRDVRGFIRDNRDSPLVWFAIVFILVYATALGASIGNFGIIARQRVHILPFLILFAAGALQWRPRVAPAPASRYPAVASG